jgi:neutral trehalase
LGLQCHIPESDPQHYSFLGATPLDRALTIGRAIIPDGHDPYEAERLRIMRLDIFRYITSFLEKSTFPANLDVTGEKGIGLSARPFLAPTGMTRQDVEKNTTKVIGSFRFAEQYRWDSLFQIQLLLQVGASELALALLMNLVDVQAKFHRIPNALTTDFLSHPQPPLETFMALELLKAGVDSTQSSWLDQTMNAVRADLLTEWLDFNSGRINPRQYEPLQAIHDSVLSRYTSVHFHSLLVGCQDGKDHNRLNADRGEHYLPVQLNCLLYAECHALHLYYAGQGNAKDAQLFGTLAQKIKEDMNRLMWVADGEWAGFRNYAIVDAEEDNKTGSQRVSGVIHTDDLAAEIWPLYTGLATPAQAKVLLRNIEQRYQGDIGLPATSPLRRNHDDLRHDLDQHWSLQWELNAWPPLMMVAVAGLQNYSQQPGDEFDQLAIKLQLQWVRALEQFFFHTPVTMQHYFPEKMPYRKDEEVQEGVYKNLPGFGWTLASYVQFMHNLADRNLVGQIGDMRRESP